MTRLTRRRSLLAILLTAVLVVVVMAWTLAAAGGSPALADSSASWQFAPAQAPPPPSGVAPSQFPEALGQVGDIEFWSPNEGLLITGGTESQDGTSEGGIIPAGLYAYDGVSWHLLSTVCGSAEGRIAYVSADEWWTISDQRPGLGLAGGGGATDAYDAVSLCHFVNDQVVGSYALPVEQSNSWPAMDAAACAGADDCWFAGGTSGTTGQSFHLYWNGTTLTEVDDPAYSNQVASMVDDDGAIFEAPTLTQASSPPPIDEIDQTDDPGDPFQPIVLRSFAGCSGICPVLPIYSGAGTTVQPYDLHAFALSSDAGAVAAPASPGQIWAVAGETGATPAPAIVLRYTNSDFSWNQIAGPANFSLPDEIQLSASQFPAEIAAEPGQDAAWVTLGGGANAGVEELSGTPNGSGGDTWSLSAVQTLGPEQGVGNLGAAGPITCPAVNDCWLATSEGWLLNWTDGNSYGQTGDPVYNGTDGIITYRPPDDGTPSVPDTTLPDDDSLANQAPPEVITTYGGKLPARQVALVSDEKATVIKGTNKLRFTFKLSAKANVQLLALRREVIGKITKQTGSGKKKTTGTGKKTTKTTNATTKVKPKVAVAAAGKTTTKARAKTRTVTVAKSKREMLGKGKHSLTLKLNPKRWPTSLKLDATAWKATSAATKAKLRR